MKRKVSFKLKLIGLIYLLISGGTLLFAQQEILDCSQINNLPTISEVKETKIKFVNTSGESVDVFWKSYDGSLVKYYTLSTNQSYIQSTFTSHFWVAKTIEGACLGIYRSTQEGAEEIHISHQGQDAPILLTKEEGRKKLNKKTAKSSGKFMKNECSEVNNLSYDGESINTSLKFVNNTTKSIDVFWVFDGGKLRKYFSVFPGKEMIQSSSTIHHWAVRTEEGDCLGIFNGTSKDMATIVFDNEDIKKARRSNAHTKLDIEVKKVTYVEHAVPPKGETKSLMLFVDFKDARARGISTRAHASKIMNKNALDRFFAQVSRNKVSNKKVDYIHGWRTMKSLSTKWTNGKKVICPNNSTEYAKEVFELYPEIDFSKYDIVMINTPKFELINSSATNYNIETPKGNQVGVIMLGYNMHVGEDAFKTIIHEYGHQYGLPDLYDTRSRDAHSDDISVGPWDIMGNVWGAHALLVYHHYFLEWLPEHRVKTVSNEWKGIVYPIENSNKTALVMYVDSTTTIPVKYCIEVANTSTTENILATNNKITNEKGVLIYKVNQAILTGENPVYVYRQKNEKVKDAPYQIGERFNEDKVPIRVNVLKGVGNGYQIEVVKK